MRASIKRAMGAWRALAARCVRALHRGGWRHVRPIDLMRGWDAAGYLPSAGHRHKPVRFGPTAEQALGLAGAAFWVLSTRDWGFADFGGNTPPGHVREPLRPRFVRKRRASVLAILEREEPRVDPATCPHPDDSWDAASGVGWICADCGVFWSALPGWPTPHMQTDGGDDGPVESDDDDIPF